MRHLRLALPAVLVAVTGTSASAVAAGEASRSPERILRDVAGELRQVRSYRVSGTTVDAHGRARLTADVLASGGLDARLRQGRQVIRLRVVPRGGTYVRANAAFWRRAGSAALARRLAGRWVRSRSGAASAAPEVSPRRLARCLVAVHGTLAERGTARVAGRRAVVVADRGDRPGTSPGRLYVAASGRTLPLRVVQTGPTRPGGRVAGCSESGDTTRASDLRFSRFDRPLRIRAPRGAIDLGGGDAASRS